MIRFLERTKKFRIESCIILLLFACMVIVPSMAKYAEKDISVGSFDLVISQNRQVFAVYGEVVDANGASVGEALNFYNRTMPTLGDTIKLDDGSVQTVTEICTGFDTAVYSNQGSVPWYNDIHNSVKHVNVIDEFAPVSMAYWF